MSSNVIPEHVIKFAKEWGVYDQVIGLDVAAISWHNKLNPFWKSEYIHLLGTKYAEYLVESIGCIDPYTVGMIAILRAYSEGKDPAVVDYIEREIGAIIFFLANPERSGHSKYHLLTKQQQVPESNPLWYRTDMLNLLDLLAHRLPTTYYSNSTLMDKIFYRPSGCDKHREMKSHIFVLKMFAHGILPLEYIPVGDRTERQKSEHCLFVPDRTIMGYPSPFDDICDMVLEAIDAGRVEDATKIFESILKPALPENDTPYYEFARYYPKANAYLISSIDILLEHIDIMQNSEALTRFGNEYNLNPIPIKSEPAPVQYIPEKQPIPEKKGGLITKIASWVGAKLGFTACVIASCNDNPVSQSTGASSPAAIVATNSNVNISPNSSAKLADIIANQSGKAAGNYRAAVGTREERQNKADVSQGGKLI